MFDDGDHGDGAASDGVFGATVPDSRPAPWSASGSTQRTATRTTCGTRGPTTRSSTTGTMVADPDLVSQLPIFFWFIDPADYADALAHR